MEILALSAIDSEILHGSRLAGATLTSQLHQGSVKNLQAAFPLDLNLKHTVTISTLGLFARETIDRRTDLTDSGGTVVPVNKFGKLENLKSLPRRFR